jgi:hypothetical protein
MNNAIKVLLQMQNGFLQLESTLRVVEKLGISSVPYIEMFVFTNSIYKLKIKIS